MKIKSMKGAPVYTLVFLCSFLFACNNRNNETDRNNDQKINQTDTRRNTTDTNNYISDSAGKSVQ